jgi:hypothetical protein
MLIASMRVEISEETAIGRNVGPAFTQHTKEAERCNSVWM